MMASLTPKSLIKSDHSSIRSNLINDYGVKEAIIEKLQDDIDIDNLENGGESEYE